MLAGFELLLLLTLGAFIVLGRWAGRRKSILADEHLVRSITKIDQSLEILRSAMDRLEREVPDAMRVSETGSTASAVSSVAVSIKQVDLRDRDSVRQLPAETQLSEPVALRYRAVDRIINERIAIEELAKQQFALSLLGETRMLRESQRTWTRFLNGAQFVRAQQTSLDLMHAAISSTLDAEIHAQRNIRVQYNDFARLSALRTTRGKSRTSHSNRTDSSSTEISADLASIAAQKIYSVVVRSGGRPGRITVSYGPSGVEVGTNYEPQETANDVARATRWLVSREGVEWRVPPGRIVRRTAARWAQESTERDSESDVTDRLRNMLSGVSEAHLGNP